MDECFDFVMFMSWGTDIEKIQLLFCSLLSSDYWRDFLKEKQSLNDEKVATRRRSRRMPDTQVHRCTLYMLYSLVLCTITNCLTCSSLPHKLKCNNTVNTADMIFMNDLGVFFFFFLIRRRIKCCAGYVTHDCCYLRQLIHNDTSAHFRSSFTFS